MIERERRGSNLEVGVAGFLGILKWRSDSRILGDAGSDRSWRAEMRRSNSGSKGYRGIYRKVGVGQFLEFGGKKIRGN